MRGGLVADAVLTLFHWLTSKKQSFFHPNPCDVYPLLQMNSIADYVENFPRSASSSLFRTQVYVCACGVQESDFPVSLLGLVEYNRNLNRT